MPPKIAGRSVSKTCHRLRLPVFVCRKAPSEFCADRFAARGERDTSCLFPAIQSKRASEREPSPKDFDRIEDELGIEAAPNVVGPPETVLLAREQENVCSSISVRRQKSSRLRSVPAAVAVRCCARTETRRSVKWSGGSAATTPRCIEPTIAETKREGGRHAGC
jgi:hypothetical protein